MKKLLLLLFLLAQFGRHAPGVVRGQTAPTPSPATQATTTTPAGQADALKEAGSLSGQVVQLYRAGKFSDALTLAERALAIREGALGANDRRIADALVNVAALRAAIKDFDKAETLYRRALTVYEAAGEGDSAAALGVLERLVFLSAVQRNFDKAEASAERLVAIAERKYKPQQLEMALALLQLAEAARLNLNAKRARTVYARVVDIVEQHAPATVPGEVRNSLANYLGLLYAHERGRDSELTQRITKLFIAIATSAATAGGGGKAMEGGVINGKALYKPQPEYPQAAKSFRAQGIVQVKITVDETGKVIEAKAIDNSLHSSLLRASEDAARRARFSPMLLGGMPIKVNGMITYRFVLQ
ncbi:MAG TPA: TonB family protein [Pyrinomonadaceae bacterium]|jgi:TonB family protein